MAELTLTTYDGLVIEDERIIDKVTRVMTQISECRDKLAALGTADQIRDYLVQEHIYGLPGVANACVLANYFNKTANTLHQIEVSGNKAYVTGVLGSGVPLPDELWTLVERFDNLRYPELDSRKIPGPNIRDWVDGDDD